MSDSPDVLKIPPVILALSTLASASVPPPVSARQAVPPPSPNLASALQSPGAYWTLLTSPQTPYADRMAAAAQGRRVFPLSQVPKLLMAIESLQEEEALHRWGFRRGQGQVTQSIAYLGKPAPSKPFIRERKILGRIWVAPANPTADYPAFGNAKAASQAPWPWQAKQALEALYNQLAPQIHVMNPPEDVAYAEKWYAVALRMPRRTDKEATRFVRMTVTPAHYKSLTILAKWRSIALDPKTPEAASLVATNLGEAMHLWDDPRASFIGEAILTDIVRRTKDSAVVREAAWGAIHLKDRQHFSHRPGGDGTIKNPTPWTLLVALGDAMTDPRYGDEWSRLYSFGIPACHLLPQAPIKGDINDFRPDSPEAKRAYRMFAAWFKSHRSEIVAKASAQSTARKEIAIVRAG